MVTPRSAMALPIRADARQEAGASLGRLLNLTDGILGHGLRVLLLITTNEPMRALHPAAVVRTRTEPSRHQAGSQSSAPAPQNEKV